MSEVTTSKVDVIIKSLSGLEDNIDSLNEKLADMKKKLNSTVQREIEKNMQKTTEMATSEAEGIIKNSKEKADTESKKILSNGDSKIAEIKKQIDSNFDEAVDHVVETILKP